MSTTLVKGPLRAMPVTQPRQTGFMAVSYDHATRELIQDLRLLTGNLLRYWAVDRETIDAVELALCELYANVCTHVQGDLRPCTVVLKLREHVLKLCVRDNDDKIPRIPDNPATALHANFGESGRGLCMVAVYAARFHYEPLAPRGAGQGKDAIAEWDVA